MKTTLLISAGLACVLVATQALATTDVTTDWYAELNTIQQDSGQTTGGRVRADAVLSSTLLAVKNGLDDHGPAQPAEAPPAGANLEAAAAQAAYAVMTVLYPQSQPALDAALAESLAGIADNDQAITAGKNWGGHVAEVVLAEQGDTILLNARTFAATAPATTSVLPDAKASESLPIGPGRYRFSSLAGTPGTRGYVDAPGAAARFDYPSGLAVDAARNLYVTEFSSFTVRKISPTGDVTTLAGMALQKGSQDGTGTAARFNGPRGLAVDGAGNVFVADSDNHTIRKISPLGVVTTLAGIAGAPGHLDGTREIARLNRPMYLTLDGDGNLLVTEYDSPKSIRKVKPDGSITTLTINSELPLLYPLEIAIGPAGKLYVNYTNDWDSHFYGVVKLNLNPAGGYDGTALVTDNSLAVDPGAYGMGVDAAGNLIIDYGAPFLAVYTPTGEFQRRYITGPPDFFTGGEMAVAPNGDVYTASIWVTPQGLLNGGIHVGIFDPSATGPVIVWGPADADRAVGGAVKFSVSALGGGPLSYQWYFNGSALSGATQATVDLSPLKLGDAGKYYVVVSDRDGSVTSLSANLAVSESAPPITGTTTTGTGSSTSSGSSAASGNGSVTSVSPTSGGGGFDQFSALVLLMLLAAAAIPSRVFPGKLVAIHWRSDHDAGFSQCSGDSNVAAEAMSGTMEER